MSGGDFYVRRGTWAPSYKQPISKRCVGADAHIGPSFTGKPSYTVRGDVGIAPYESTTGKYP